MSRVLQGRGLVTLFELDGLGAAVLIPDTLPLPDWYSSRMKKSEGSAGNIGHGMVNEPVSGRHGSRTVSPR